MRNTKRMKRKINIKKRKTQRGGASLREELPANVLHNEALENYIIIQMGWTVATPNHQLPNNVSNLVLNDNSVYVINARYVLAELSLNGAYKGHIKSIEETFLNNKKMKDKDKQIIQKIMSKKMNKDKLFAKIYDLTHRRSNV